MLEMVMRYFLLMKAGAMQHWSVSALDRKLFQRGQASPDPGTQQSWEGNWCLGAYRGKERWKKEVEFTFASLFYNAVHTQQQQGSWALQWWEASAICSCVLCSTLWHGFHLSYHSCTELLLEGSCRRLQVTAEACKSPGKQVDPASTDSSSVLVSWPRGC